MVTSVVAPSGVTPGSEDVLMVKDARTGPLMRRVADRRMDIRRLRLGGV